VADVSRQEAIVVDPGGDADKILALLARHQLRVTKIVHTHAHFDHFLASGQLREATQAPLALHPDDAPLWHALPEQCARFGLAHTPVPPPDAWLEDEFELCAGSLRGRALHTPGHSPGSTCFHFQQLETSGLLLAGDTLFRRSVGRTDLWGGDFGQLRTAIQTRLYTLHPATCVVPGHGPQTTIGDELEHNPLVRAQGRPAP
jgi:glyoxylase-like metal-dependent hydrolase (beta-lactamase superfamily II)